MRGREAGGNSNLNLHLCSVVVKVCIFAYSSLGCQLPSAITDKIVGVFLLRDYLFVGNIFLQEKKLILSIQVEMWPLN